MALTKVPSNLDSITATTQSASDNSTNVATTAYVTTAVSNIVDGAPSTLNTLNEIAAALNDDAALNTTLTTSIATKLPLAGGTMTGNLIGTQAFFSPNTAGKNTITLTTNASDDGRILIKSDTTDKVDIQANGASYFNGGNVGIGTSSPLSKLHVFSSVADNLRLERDSTNDWRFMLTGGALAIRDATADTERVRIDSSGNVGIGTTPSRPLHVVGADGGLALFSNNVDADLNIQTASAVTLITPSTGTLAFGTSSTERMRINSSGAVLMGTTTQLHSSQLTVDNPSGQCGITLSETGTSVTALWGLDSLNAIGTRSNHAFNIRSNDTNRMTFDSSGKVFIGLTAQINSSMLSVGDGGVGITYSGAPANYYRQIYQSSSGNLFFYNGSNQGYIDQAGAFNDASDERIKKDIEDISYGLDTVKALKPRKYKMKLNDDEQIGFIAQEVESLVPEIVNTDVTPDGEEQKGMSYGHLTAVLTKAIQEQQTLIETLQAKVEALENG